VSLAITVAGGSVGELDKGHQPAARLRLQSAQCPEREQPQGEPDAGCGVMNLHRGLGSTRQTEQAQPWRYDLGHGYCRYEFFAQCPHRLACARCDYYEPKDSQAVLIFEAQGNLVRLRQDLLLTDEEREAIDGDVLTFQKLRAKRWDSATPAGPSPRALDECSAE
jgi:hypothetical protein